MNLKEAIKCFRGEPSIYEVTEPAEHEGKVGFVVKNKQFNTTTFFAEEFDWSKVDAVGLFAITHWGRNVESMTRISGYYSVTSNWNKGKVAELRDRYKMDGGI